MAKNDTYSQAGAERLARTIERKWRQKGEAVKAWAYPQIVPGHSEEIWFVKSDLVNGLPSGRSVLLAA